MIIRISLWLVSASVVVFIATDYCAWIDMHNLANSLSRLGSAILLGAFALLIMKGLLSAGNAIVHSAAEYLSARQRSQRRLLFNQYKQDQLNRLFYFKTQQLRYFNLQKRKRLLAGNNRKHLHDLSSAIKNDLSSIRHKIPAAAFKQLQLENNTYCSRQDAEALLDLQQKIAGLVTDDVV